MLKKYAYKTLLDGNTLLETIGADVKMARRNKVADLKKRSNLAPTFALYRNLS